MPYYRDPQIQSRYDKQILKDKDACPFCFLDPSRKKIEESDSYYIVSNLMPYDLWDLRKVDEHLLLIPKAHIGSLSELNAEDSAEIMRQISACEHQGYNIYARASQNKTKSVVHQHTHLIKTSGPQLASMGYTHSPYTRTIIFEDL